MRFSTPTVIVICGPTATGKSALALQVAQALGAPILNADSRQIYRGFDIGTAKPTTAEQKQWPHYLIDIADPTETFTVAQYQTQASQLIQKLHQHHQIPLVVGGTGLYIQSITAGLSIPAVPPQPHLREQLSHLPQATRYAYLQAADPLSTQKIHANDAVRTIRALEIFYTTGHPASTLRSQTPPPFNVIMIGLTTAMEQLKTRIDRRSMRMLEAGWIDEVRHLHNQYGADLPLLKTLGYAEISQYLNQEMEWDQVQPLIVKHTRQFAKRQLTWFRRVAQIEWFDCEDPGLVENVFTWLASRR